MSTIATYSPEDIVIILAGVYTVEGMADGEFVSISKDSSQYTTSYTADGRVSRTNVEDPTHTVSLTLASYSDSNLVFTTWAESDKLIHSVTVPIFIKDTMGSSMFYAPMCWIEKTPDTSFDVGVTDRTWTLRTAGGKLVSGGNQSGELLNSSLAQLGFIAADFGGLL